MLKEYEININNPFDRVLTCTPMFADILRNQVGTKLSNQVVFLILSTFVLDESL